MALLGWYVWPEEQAKTTVASTPQVSSSTQQPTTTTISPPQPASSANPPTHKPASKRPADRHEQERLWRMARGEEPNGPPHPYIDDPSLTEEQRLNRMSVGELQKYLADTVLKLKEFEQRWDYPESQTFDAPPEGPDGKQDPDQIKRYFRELEKRQNNVNELRPRKRAEAFKKEFPRVDLPGSYLYQRWPDVEGMENCVLQEKMNDRRKLDAEFLRI